MDRFRHFINGLLLLFVALRLTSYFYHPPMIRFLSGIVLLLIFLSVLPFIKRTTLIVMSVMLSGGLALLISSGAPFDTWLNAFLQNANLIALLICVPMISLPFYYDDYQSELRSFAQLRMQNVMGFLVLVSFSTHIMAVMISIGAMMVMYNLMFPFATLYKAERGPFLRAVTRGYYSSGFWSPAWATVIIFSAHPDVLWIRIVPVGIFFALIYLGINFFTIHLEIRRHPGRYPNISPEPGTTVNYKKLYTMLALVFSLILSIALLNATTDWDFMFIVPAVSIVFPIVAAVILRFLPRYQSSMRSYYNKTLRGTWDQAALFAMAGFLGRALDASGAGHVLAEALPSWLVGFSPLMIMALVLIMLVPSLIGVHPTAVGTAMVVVLVPANLGLSSYTFALAMMLGWTLSLSVAPFSITAMMLAAANGRSSFQNSFLLNWKFISICLVVFSLLISVIGPRMG